MLHLKYKAISMIFEWLMLFSNYIHFMRSLEAMIATTQ